MCKDKKTNTSTSTVTDMANDPELKKLKDVPKSGFFKPVIAGAATQFFTVLIPILLIVGIYGYHDHVRYTSMRSQIDELKLRVKKLEPVKLPKPVSEQIPKPLESDSEVVI